MFVLGTCAIKTLACGTFVLNMLMFVCTCLFLQGVVLHLYESKVKHVLIPQMTYPCRRLEQRRYRAARSLERRGSWPQLTEELDGEKATTPLSRQ
jgi:hypothetical protein